MCTFAGMKTAPLMPVPIVLTVTWPHGPISPPSSGSRIPPGQPESSPISSCMMKCAAVPMP
tara:strand:+ start:108782 stop:108964 length:183 start_codon:yes stop_codon:yes gene_type:complete